MNDLTLTWAGEASDWECDDLGHLNMRYYFYKVAQAREMLFLRLGLTHCFSQGAHATIDVRDYHIKYIAEARPGSPLRIFSGIADLGETDMRLIHVMYHADDRVACTVIETVRHMYLRGSRSFEWPDRVRESYKRFMAQVPDVAKPRGLDLETPPLPISQQIAAEKGMSHLGCGVFRPDEADIFGRVTPQALLGRVTETVGHFVSAWPEMYLEDFGRNRSVSGALLEARISLGESPKPGQGYDFYSGIQSANPNVRSLLHKIFDIETGAQIMSMQGVGCLIDLKARKHVKTSAETIAAMTKVAVDIQF